MTGSKRGKRAELQRWLSQREAEPSLPTCPGAPERGAGPRPAEAIGEAEFAELLRSLAPVSESYLRKLLRESGAPLAPMIVGVRQKTLEGLEASLLALLDEYERGDPPRRAAVRRLVITAKDHARWATRKPPSASNKPASDAPASDKSEMILWMVTWLENPPVFREWIRLRRIQLGRIQSGP